VLAPRSRAVSGGKGHGQRSATREGSSRSVTPKPSCIRVATATIALTHPGSLISMALPLGASLGFAVSSANARSLKPCNVLASRAFAWVDFCLGNAAATTRAMRAPGSGRINLSQRGSLSAGEAQQPTGLISTSVARASHMAPGVILWRGPFGPSTAMSTSLPQASAASMCRRPSPRLASRASGTGVTSSASSQALMALPCMPGGTKAMAARLLTSLWSASARRFPSCQVIHTVGPCGTGAKSTISTEAPLTTARE
jgi:hypothetical protein